MAGGRRMEVAVSEASSAKPSPHGFITHPLSAWEEPLPGTLPESSFLL